MNVVPFFAKSKRFTRLARAIYTKDKDLDKSKYKPNELEQLNVYVKNYMEDDPKNLPEAERKRLLEEAQKLQ